MPASSRSRERAPSAATRRRAAISSPSAQMHRDPLRRRPRSRAPRSRAESTPSCFALARSAVEQRAVLDHVGERLARRDLAGEGQKHRPHRVVELGVGDDHVEDRLRPAAPPRPTRRWSRTGAAPPPRSPRRARRCVPRPSAGSATVDGETLAEPLAQRDRQRQAGEAAAGDQHVRVLVLVLTRRSSTIGSHRRQHQHPPPCQAAIID